MARPKYTFYLIRFLCYYAINYTHPQKLIISSICLFSNFLFILPVSETPLFTLTLSLLTFVSLWNLLYPYYILFFLLELFVTFRFSFWKTIYFTIFLNSIACSLFIGLFIKEFDLGFLTVALRILSFFLL